MTNLFAKAGAIISDCGLYRYLLTREWDREAPPALFVMLNPSTADATRDDPTVRRCVGFARAWGCGGLRVANLFAFRSASPGALHDAADPVGPDNDRHLREAAAGAKVVVAAWGVMGALRDREGIVGDLLREAGVSVRCLGTTKGGHPRHPLYVPAAQPLVPLEGRAGR